MLPAHSALECLENHDALGLRACQGHARTRSAALTEQGEYCDQSSKRRPDASTGDGSGGKTEGSGHWWQGRRFRDRALSDVRRCTRRGVVIAWKRSLTFVGVLLLLIEMVATWHAFSDQERMPDVPGTSMRSDLVLPQGLIDKCHAATTSLRKALLVCGVGFSCSLKCAASWNSAMRDARAIIGTPCRSFELLMNEHLVGDLSALRVGEPGASPFNYAKWASLRSWCENESVCGKNLDYSPLVNPCSDSEGQCRDGMSADSECVQLTPPASKCPNFSFKGQERCSGSGCYKTLTWWSLQQYQTAGLGCVGGLGDKGDAEYTTWACIHDTSCQFLVDYQDYACFKYSHIRAEFHFWHFNSVLKLLPPLSRVDVSFCDESGSSTLQDAQTSAQVDLSTVTYVFERMYSDGLIEVEASGYAPDLGDKGCGKFQLTKNAKFRVHIDAGPSHFKWMGYIFTTDKDVSINAGLYPTFTECSRLALTLSWCEEAENDLDLWIFMPGSDKQIKTDVSRAVYWKNLKIETSDYNFNYKLDDKGGGLQGNPRTFGPESLYLEGNLPEGTYAVMVHAYSNNPTSTLRGNCPVVSLYSNTTTNYLAVEGKGSEGNWWHVLNLFVTSVPSGDFKMIEYAVVDQMIPMTCSAGSCGPTIDMNGNMVNTFQTPLASTETMQRVPLFAFKPDTRTCGQPVAIGITVRDAVTNANLQSVGSAAFAVNWKAGAAKYPVSQAFLQYAYAEKYNGGYHMFAGSAEISTWANGYMDQKVTVIVSPKNRYFELFSLPADGQTRVVLNWGNQPRDLDLYIIPIDVVGFDKQPVSWTSQGQKPITDQQGQDPYVYHGLSTGCVCPPYTAGFKPTLSLDREDKSHGLPFAGDTSSPTPHQPSFKGLIGNGCETATLRDMLPGTYHIYVNAFDAEPIVELREKTFVDSFSVDIYLGDGKESVVKMDTVHHSTKGGKWFYAGFIEVFIETKAKCQGIPQSVVVVANDKVDLCASWNRRSKLSEYPLSGNIQ